jgi:hypothetical protein
MASDNAPYQFAGAFLISSAERAGDGRDDAPADRTLRQRTDPGKHWKDQRNAGQNVDTESGQEIDLDQADRELGEHDQRVRDRHQQ